MKFGDDSCGRPGDRWKTAYNGYAMTLYKSTGSSSSSAVVCVDNKPDADMFRNSVTNGGAPEISFVRSGFGFSASDKIITCSICLKL